MKRITVFTLVLLFSQLSIAPAEQYGTSQQWSDKAQQVIDLTKPLTYSRGGRLPIFSAPSQDPGKLDNSSAVYLVKELDKRGIAVICSWDPKTVMNRCHRH